MTRRILDLILSKSGPAPLSLAAAAPSFDLLAFAAGLFFACIAQLIRRKQRLGRFASKRPRNSRGRHVDCF